MIIKRPNHRYIATCLLWLLTIVGSRAAVEQNAFFTITTPDDSWTIRSEGGRQQTGARVMMSRNGLDGHPLDLARIDFVELPYTPESYLHTQVVRRRDLFAQDATDITAMADTMLLGLPAKRVTFCKTTGNRPYRCAAWVANAGFGTLMVVTAHRADAPNVVDRIVAQGLTIKADTSRLHSAAGLVQAATMVLKHHGLPMTEKETLRAVSMPDTSTIQLTVVEAYITQDVVDVPRFVQAKRNEWMQAHNTHGLRNLLVARAMAERLNLRYFYVDNRGREIGTLLIMPEEYEHLLPKQNDDQSE